MKLLEHKVKENSEKQNEKRTNKEIQTALLKIITTAIVILCLLYMCKEMGENPLPTKNQTSHKVNEFFIVDDGKFIVTDFQKYLGDGSDVISVTFEVENIGKKEITIGSGMVKVIDNKKRVFESDWDSTWPGSLNPGIKGSGKVRFEIPKDASELLVSFRTDMFDFGGADYAYVKLE